MKKGKRLNTSSSEKKLEAAWDKFMIPLIVTVIGGLIVTVWGGLVLNSIIQKDNASNGELVDNTVSEETEKLLASIQKLSIGSSKDWVDDRLGPPYAENLIEITENERAWPHTEESSKVGEILECVYIFDVASVKIYFDTSENSCRAFFVTLMENTFGVDILIPEAYSTFVSNMSLGEFTFSDIWDGEWPLNIYGYASNGVGRVFYGEQYYFAGGGNYQDFYFAVLDYGMLNSISEFDRFISEVQCDIVPGLDSDNGRSVLSSSSLLVEQRSRLYPNTYGISVLNRDLTFSLFSSYTGFDSASFRKHY